MVARVARACAAARVRARIEHSDMAADACCVASEGAVVAMLKAKN